MRSRSVVGRTVALAGVTFSVVSLASATVDEALFRTWSGGRSGPTVGGGRRRWRGFRRSRGRTTSGRPAAGCGRRRTPGRAGRAFRMASSGVHRGGGGVGVGSERRLRRGWGEDRARERVARDGIWKSVDAGATWEHKGLADSRHVPRIRIHPRDPDLVYAAVLGHLFGPNEERGVYRSVDGGDTWERVLFANENAGAVDLVMDPTNPRVLYASDLEGCAAPRTRSRAAGRARRSGRRPTAATPGRISPATTGFPRARSGSSA